MKFTHPYSSKKCTIKCTQVPIMPAFSMTAHKAQGQTLAKVIIDLECCNCTESPWLAVVPPTQASATGLATYKATKAVWNNKNGQVLGLMQAIVSPVIWQDYNHLSVAKDLFACIRGHIQKSRGSIDLPPVGQHGGNSIYQFNGFAVPDTTIPGQLQSITLNSHSSKNLATFMFFSSLPDSYELTT